MRSAIAFGFGMSRYPIQKFAPFNFLGALIWAVFTAGLGYYFGRAIEPLLGQIKNVELVLIGAGVAARVVFWFWHRHSKTCNASA